MFHTSGTNQAFARKARSLLDKNKVIGILLENGWNRTSVS